MPDSPAVGTVHKDDRPLTTIDQWHRFAPPKRDIHWKDGRSAKENARAWIDAAPGLQPDIGCFRHQLLLPRPYLVLTKPLRLDIQCQRGASVKIGWKCLDD